MKIPTTIRVGTHKYTVALVDNMPSKHTRARVYYGLRRIELGRNSNVSCKKFSDTQVTDAFWHEVTHAILNDMGRDTLNRDERFVNAFAARLTQVIKTAKFEC